MNHNRFYNFLFILLFILCIISCTAGEAREIELELFGNHSKASSQIIMEQTPHKSGLKLGLRIMGGASLLDRNDINDHLQGINDLYDDAPFLIPDSKYETIQMSQDFSGEILIYFTPHFGIGIGAGYLSAGKESTVSLEPFWVTTLQTRTLHPKFSAIPITASLYCGIPLGKHVEAVLNAGLGYYLGTVNYDKSGKQIISGITYEGTESWSAQSNALGYHGGLDLEFGLSNNLALVLGARGRYAKLTDLTGDFEWETHDSLGGSKSGTHENWTLWFGTQEDLYVNEKYPQMIFSEDKPGGIYYTDVRKAEVNLNSVTFQAGLKITF